jgi:hypothetical protein
MANGVIIGGNSYELLHPKTGCPIPVFNWKDTGMEFKIGDGYNKRRKEDITLGVIHWTGSENSVETMFNVLNKRKLGVEYCISPYGSLYQFCDMIEVDTADAGAANKISWGVEVVNAGIRRANTLWREPRYRKTKMGPRRGYETRIHDRNVKCWDFYEEQTMTLLALNLLIHHVVPTYGPNVCVANGEINWREFKGAVGHYHITKKKLDPGTEPMKRLHSFMESSIFGSGSEFR